MTKFNALLALGAGLAVSACAVAEHRPYGGQSAAAQYDLAEVLSAEPQYQYVRVPTSREVCWDEEVRHVERGPGNTAGAVIGGVIGGLAGHQVGSGRGNTAATVAGTLAGAAVGSNVNRGSNRHYRSVQERCRLERDYHEERRLQGYRVTYLYNGQTYTTRTGHDPGEYIRVRVAVSPAE